MKRIKKALVNIANFDFYHYFCGKMVNHAYARQPRHGYCT